MARAKFFENAVTKDGVYYSRYYASWIRGGGDPEEYWAFKEWLKSLGLDEITISDICWLAENGKLELQVSVKRWLKSHPEAKLERRES